jgi:hypothetical protein
MRRGAAVRALLVWLGIAAASWSVDAEQSPATVALMPKKLRIALVPLDDRPVCLQYPQLMAGLAHAEVVAPPVPPLGRFTTPGDPDAIARWLRDQDWRSIDALVVSIDMLAYGGLVASRVHAVGADVAVGRLSVLEEIRKTHPALPIYGFSVIMRLAPTADDINAAWREKLARYAELVSATTTPAEVDEVAALTRQIPAAALDDYRKARARNRRLNLAAVDLAGRKVLDYLVVSQDDARPRGMHLADRAEITARVRHGALSARVGIQPGADEVAMLLLTRAVLEQRNLSPVVRVTYSSEQARTMVAPYEDRPLHDTVSFQIVAASGAEIVGTGHIDLHLFVFASRHDDGRPRAFAAAVAESVRRGAPAIVADVDPKGDVQGASPDFTEALLAAKVFPGLYGYASWNTAGNTLGTAISHGLLAWAGARLATRCSSAAFTAMADAQVTFLLHRLLNDYAYQGVLRPVINDQLRAAGRDAAWVRTHSTEIVARIEQGLRPRLAEYTRQFAPGYVPPAPGPTDIGVQVGEPRNLQVRLPWSRTFEAAITFEVPVMALMGPARRLPACRSSTP